VDKRLKDIAKKLKADEKGEKEKGPEKKKEENNDEQSKENKWSGEVESPRFFLD
jgi:hypothetical protein